MHYGHLHISHMKGVSLGRLILLHSLNRCNSLWFVMVARVLPFIMRAVVFAARFIIYPLTVIQQALKIFSMCRTAIFRSAHKILLFTPFSGNLCQAEGVVKTRLFCLTAPGKNKWKEVWACHKLSSILTRVTVMAMLRRCRPSSGNPAFRCRSILAQLALDNSAIKFLLWSFK